MTTLERLQAEYQEADLHPRKTEMSKEEEWMKAYENFWLWPYLFWVVFIAAIILPGVIERWSK
jgi:hypothetical protein